MSFQTAPSYNSEWGFEDGAQQDIFEAAAPSSSSSSSTVAPADTKTAPVEVAQNRVVVVDSEDKQTKTLPVGDVNRFNVFTSVVIATRYHYATVTAQAQNLKLEQRDESNLDRRNAPPQPRAVEKARMAHIRRASPHRL